ncbi:MAG: hypothetical protein LBQ91_06050 [Oscillospiraceae bacterium]|nr:hypothetical protein [Oscillospiraceae bacterium]
MELGFSCSSIHSKSAYAAGGYFFRFAGKSNQKGATSFRKKQIFFYAGQTQVRQCGAFPHNDRCGAASERLRTAAHRGEAGDEAKDLG